MRDGFELRPTDGERIGQQSMWLRRCGSFVSIELVGVVSLVSASHRDVYKRQVPELGNVKKVGVVCQTTLQNEFFKKVVSECALKFKEVRAYNTICYDTDERQTETRVVAANVDAVVVVGGRNSANTCLLYTSRCV